MKVEVATVTWEENLVPGKTRAVSVFIRPWRKTAIFPSKNGQQPPRGISAVSRTRQPNPGEVEECVLVIQNGSQHVFTAFPLKE